ncbi:hypothetical protein [Streptomyces sp. NPDC059009]|uniref:hypothetical protein n=1 Tax=Streptomyces sp. NPDC059009 TaxID=3346694 RepID=UPI0036BF1F60
MRFCQIIDFETDRIDEMRELIGQFDQQNAGRAGGPTHRIILQDRDNPRRYLVIVEFASHEDAVRNNERPETQQLSERLIAMCTRRPGFTDCDVREMTELK